MGDECPNFRQEFDGGYFSEEEIRVIKRLCPTSLATDARKMKRRDFFRIATNILRNSTIKLTTIRNTLYSISLGLSKRISGEEVPDKILSLRSKD